MVRREGLQGPLEIVESLGRQAARTLQRLGYGNVHTRIGDGFQGWPEHAPFDKIIVTCSPESVPEPLVQQHGVLADPADPRSLRPLAFEYRRRVDAGAPRAAVPQGWGRRRTG